MPEVVVEGLKELEASLLKIETKTAAKTLRLALRESALPIAEKIKSKVPVNTGDLKKSIRVSSSTGTGKKGTHSARARILIGGRATKKRNKAFYAAAVEFGTSKRAAHSYVRPAFDEGVEKAISEFGDILGDKIIKAVGKKNGK